MASYTAPSENLPIFDPSVFINDLTPITIAEGDKRYLRFPFAQGTEYFGDIIVGGSSTFSGVASFNETAVGSLTSLAVQPATNDNTTKIPTTSWVQSVVSALPLPSSLLALNNTWTGTQNWTSATEGSLTSSATQPATNDNTTKIPTTAWVQSLVATLPLPSSLLALNNTWTGTQNWTSATEGSLTSSATQPLANDNSTKIPTTAWVQSAITAVGSLLGLNNVWTGTQQWNNTAEGALTSLATQPAYTDSSTKIPTTAWIQGFIGQYLAPITVQSTIPQQFYPPTPLHIYGQGYINGFGGLAGDPATPDMGPWDMGGAGGGAGGVSFTFHLQNNSQFVGFDLNQPNAFDAYLSFNTSAYGGSTFASAPCGVKGDDAAIGGGGGAGGVGVFTAVAPGGGLISLSGSAVSGTAGTAGTGGQTGSSLVFPVGGTQLISGGGFGYGQTHPAMSGYNTSGYINYPAGDIGEPICLITWYVSPP